MSNESLEFVREDANFVSAERPFHNLHPCKRTIFARFEVFFCQWNSESFWRTFFAGCVEQLRDTIHHLLSFFELAHYI